MYRENKQLGFAGAGTRAIYFVKPGLGFVNVGRARGDHHPDSDADVAVLLDGGHLPFLDTKLKMSDAAYDVLLATGINISPLPVWLDEWEHPETYANPALLANVAREGVSL